MALPIKTFWLMSRNVQRVRAELDIRDLMTGVSTQDPEAFKTHHQKLVLELRDEPISVTQKLNEERDQTGFEKLKAMVG